MKKEDKKKLWKKIQTIPRRNVTPKQLAKDLKKIKEEMTESEF